MSEEQLNNSKSSEKPDASGTAPPEKEGGINPQLTKTPAKKPVKKKVIGPKKKPVPKEPLPSLIIASSPHVAVKQSIEKIMYLVVLALIPACLASVYFFGFSILKIFLVSVVGCVFFEAVFLKLFQPEGDWTKTFLDGSAIVTGLLLAMNLSASVPLWLVIVGAFIAMLLGKHVYGGLGQNPFNPAIVARIFLLISFPKQMTVWVAAKGDVVDAVSYATPLGVLQMNGAKEAMSLSKLGLFLGKCGGCLGETCVIALIIGGILLLALKLIRWHIPVSYIGTVFVLTGIMWLIDPGKYADPVFHILTGGLMLGAIFMATDMVTSPITGRGMLVFGLGCGILTFVIRLFGSYPEGVSFAILIMNGFTPLIDRYIKGPRFGLKAALTAEKA
jgi:H+/Na+-translocating ferredoxin:NAD+ oxidoreductase subunit D